MTDEYPNSKFIEVQRLAIESCEASYEENDWLPIGLQRLAEACTRLENTDLAKSGLLTACENLVDRASCVMQSHQCLDHGDGKCCDRDWMLETIREAEIAIANARKDMAIKSAKATNQRPSSKNT